MRRTQLLGACALLALAARADDSGHAWKVGDVIETELSSEGELYEKSPEGDARGKQSLKLHYVDRVEKVEDGKVTQITRHVFTASLREDGEDLGELGLTKRTLTLTRGEKDRVQGTWGAGGRVNGTALELVSLGPWPDVDRTWRLDLGARKGSLAGVEVERFEGKDVPPPVLDAIKTCGLPSLTKGGWALTVKEAWKPTGSLELKFDLEGRETLDEGEALVVGQTTTLKLVRRKARSETLPADQPPARGEEPGYEEDDLGGDMDEPPYPEDDEEPYPEPEPGPEPDDDDWGTR